MQQLATAYANHEPTGDIKKIELAIAKINKEIDSVKNEKQNKLNHTSTKEIDLDFMLQLVSLNHKKAQG